ncbi:MAG: CRISPR-associated RAMP protein Csx7 [Pseudomonas sp.]|uniref:type III CRISPR-associated RAMP protein Csx7 n=1 Tax=Pseudomonas sp. TaxID=306 RepID=UPI00391D0E5D
MSEFHRFQNELHIQGELVLETALHIGAGRTDLFGQANQVVKTYDGLPYIPGSSLKGTLRSLVERISHLEQLPRQGSAAPCISTDELCSQREHEDRLHDSKHRRQMLPAELAAKVAERSCPICHLFGNTLMAGKVQFFDGSVDPDTWVQQYDHRNGIQIDRDRLTVSGSLLYEFEAVPAGTAFHISIRALNLSPVEKVWLFAALELFRQGEVTMGGKAARGLGKVQGRNWTVMERTANNFFATVLKKEQKPVPFEEYASSILAGLA